MARPARRLGVAVAQFWPDWGMILAVLGIFLFGQFAAATGVLVRCAVTRYRASPICTGEAG